MDNLIEKSYNLFEAAKISGLDYRDYLALILFCDAFVDIAQKEYPQIAEKVIEPGLPILDSVWDYFDKNDMDIWTFVDRRPAYQMVMNLNRFWKEADLTAEDLVKFDENSFVNLALQAVGREVSLADDKKVKTFLDDRKAQIPQKEDLGIDLDTKRYESVYQALEYLKDKSKEVTEDRKDQKCTHIRSAIDSLTQARKSFDPKKLHILDRVIYDLEGFL
jgi:hypothetical protein